MSLNDEVLGEIENESVVDNNTVHAPSLLPRSSVNITLIPETEVIQAKETIDVDELESLPEMNVKFKLVDEGKTTLTSLQEVEAQILAQESISVSTARYVNETFGGDLFSGNIKESFYTPAPTKTNFEYVKSYMRNKIAVESHALMANFQVLLDVPLEDAKTRLAKMRDVYMPAARDSSLKATAVILDIKDSVSSKKNVVIPFKEDTVPFRNILTADLKTIDPSKIDHAKIEYELTSILQTMKSCLDNSHFSRFIYGVLHKESLSSCLDKTRPDCKVNTLSFMDLVELYGNDGVYDAIKELFDHSQACIDKLEDIQKTSNEYKESVEKITDYLTREGSKIRECFDSLEFFYSFIGSVNQFNLAVYNLTEFIQTL